MGLPVAPAVGKLVQGNSMAKPVVIVVGADKGGVGKTTVSRTLLDYFSANNVPTRAFDTVIAARHPEAVSTPTSPRSGPT